MTDLLQSKEFLKLEAEYPFLRRAREESSGLRALDCVVVDIETTGLEPSQSEITEIAAIKITKGRVQDSFNSLIRIATPLPAEIIRLTGITDKLLEENGKPKATTLTSLNEFIKNLPLIAHNTDFDIPFINYHLNKELGISLTNPQICTLKLSRRLLPGLASYKLGQIAEHFKIPTPLAHRAAGDAETTYQLWLKLTELLAKQGIHKLESLLKIL